MIKASGRGGRDLVGVRDRKQVAGVPVQVPGVHNVLNALGAFAALSEVGLEPEEIARWLGEFEGTGRRFEVKGTEWGVTVVEVGRSARVATGASGSMRACGATHCRLGEWARNWPGQEGVDAAVAAARSKGGIRSCPWASATRRERSSSRA